MKTRWMLKGSLLTLVTVLVLAGSSWVGVAAQKAQTTPAAPAEAAEGDASPVEFASTRMGGRIAGMWFQEDEERWGPIAYLAGIIGIPAKELWNALLDGQTLAEIAAANGMTRQELVDALEANAEGLLALAAGAEVLDDTQVSFFRDWLADGVELAVDHPWPVGQAWCDLHTMDMDGAALLDAEDYDLPERLAATMGLTLQELAAGVLEGQSLADLAAAQGVGPAEVSAFLTAEAQAELDEALAAGYLNQEQVDVLRGWLLDGVPRAVDNGLVPPDVFGLLERLAERSGGRAAGVDWERWAAFDWAGLIGRDPVSAAAASLGISRGELLEGLSAGETLATLAGAQGVELQGVVDAVTGSAGDILAELAAGGLLPADKVERWQVRVGVAVEFFAENGLPRPDRMEHGHGELPLHMLERFGCNPPDGSGDE